MGVSESTERLNEDDIISNLLQFYGRQNGAASHRTVSRNCIATVRGRYRRVVGWCLGGRAVAVRWAGDGEELGDCWPSWKGMRLSSCLRSGISQWLEMRRKGWRRQKYGWVKREIYESPVR